jgi:hypothetical protein
MLLPSAPAATVRRVMTSASAIAGGQALEMDHYCLPASSSSFIANRRLQELRSRVKRTYTAGPPSAHAQALLGVNNVRSFGVAAVNEDRSCRLVLEKFLDPIETLSGSVKREARQVMARIAFVVAGPLSSPEPCLCTPRHEVPWLVTEAKKPSDSLLKALPQGCMLGGDIALAHFRAGVSLQDCAVPIVLSAGDCIQIFGAFLLPDAFPVFCTLSPALCLFERNDLTRLGVWIEELAKFGEQSIALVKAPTFDPRQLGQPQDVAISLTQLFFKPVRAADAGNGEVPNESTHRAAVTRILDVYQHIWDTLPEGPARNSIQFPLGTMQLPRHRSPAEELIPKVSAVIKRFLSHKPYDTQPLTPLLVFPLLPDTWSSTPPDPGTPIAAAYVACVRTAVDALTAQNVVLLDLRPDNIMWNGATGRVQVLLVDFEDVVLAGTVFSEATIDRWALDARYRSRDFGFDDGAPKMSINSHWVTAIENFTKRANAEQSFTEFMRQQEGAPRQQTAAGTATATPPTRSSAASEMAAGRDDRVGDADDGVGGHVAAAAPTTGGGMRSQDEEEQANDQLLLSSGGGSKIGKQGSAKRRSASDSTVAPADLPNSGKRRP